ncbi:MAG: hypothetical protein WAK04_02905, partial [Xanthobacteraceae bacterium]
MTMEGGVMKMRPVEGGVCAENLDSAILVMKTAEMRGAPQSTFSRLICRIEARSSALTGGRAPRTRDFQPDASARMSRAGRSSSP